MMLEVTYFASDYQSWGQIFLDSYLDQRIDLADCIYFLSFRHLSRKNDYRLIIISLLLASICSVASIINFQFAVKSSHGVRYNCKPTCKTINYIVLHSKAYLVDIRKYRLICFMKMLSEHVDMS